MIAWGEFGCSTELTRAKSQSLSVTLDAKNDCLLYLPAISEATLPSAVVVVVATFRTPRLIFVKMCFGLTKPLSSDVGDSMDLPGMSVECRYSVTSDLTACF